MKARGSGGERRGEAAEIRARLVKVELDEALGVRGPPEVEHERAVAIYDLLEQNRFALVNGMPGPYALVLGIEENRLVLDVRTAERQPLLKVGLALGPFRRIVKDYFTICESYYDAIKRLSPSQIEAIDMGRRGLHDEGSRLLRDRLRGKIDVDHDTARRLFTLLCVLHIRS